MRHGFHGRVVQLLCDRLRKLPGVLSGAELPLQLLKPRDMQRPDGELHVRHRVCGRGMRPL